MYNYELELLIDCYSEKTLKAIYNAIKPDTLDAPKNCSVDILLREKKISLTIRCIEINDLRALFNSYFSIISSLIRVEEVMK
ncbi:MAG: hypothetical protein B6U89_03455 [Desulfurococcales archaeon ex4484_58]|nr:MAG: hypothetical protein B6U89_03455 [Desulfurococcales archaeon ex4484_58]